MQPTEWSVIVDTTSESDRKDIADLKARVSDLESSVNGLKSQVGWLTHNTAVPFIRNVAAQTLLFLIGDQPMVPQPQTSKYASIVCGDQNHMVLENVGSDTRFTLSKARFAAICDPLIVRRNRTSHFGTVTELDTAVTNALLAFDVFQELSYKCKEEYDIISNYHVIRDYFPPSTPI